MSGVTTLDILIGNRLVDTLSHSGDVGSGLALSWGVSEAVALARSFRLASPAAVSHVTSCGYA